MRTLVRGDLLVRLPWFLTLLGAFLVFWADRSSSSYTWRLDLDVGKVIVNENDVDDDRDEGDSEDEKRGDTIFNIVMTTVTDVDGTWKKTAKEKAKRVVSKATSTSWRNNRGVLEGVQENSDYGEDDEEGDDEDDEVLECGKPANFTYYDHLIGIQNRQSHPRLPEPDVALSAFKVSSKKSIERRLKRAKREHPKSVDLYNQMGNFWRVVGDTQRSIECFRRALAVSPNNAEVLLNLARVLFNLQYLDDAIFLTRRSLEVQPPDHNAWQQHFQLGEILKAYCHYQEAALHLRHVLELKPNYAPAIEALQEMESFPDASVHIYTIFIIVLLVLGVLFWTFCTMDPLATKTTETMPGRAGVRNRQKKAL